MLSTKKHRYLTQIPAQQSHSASISTIIPVSLGVLLLSAIGLGHFLNRRRMPSTCCDVALIFGTGLPWKARARAKMAAQLFQQGLVRFLIVSGGVLVPGTSLTEAAWFRDWLVACGVPRERILLEEKATNTAENARYALPIILAHHFRSVVLVMSDFEGIRAHLTAKRAWQGHTLTLYDCHAPSVGHWHPWSWWLTHEGWSLTCYTVSRLFRYRLWRYLWWTCSHHT